MLTFKARLSPTDQIMPMLHVPMVFCFRSADPRRAARALAEGLRKTVHQLPFLGGHIDESGDNGYSAISWSKENDVVFEELDGAGLPRYVELAAANVPLPTLDRDFRPSHAGSSLSGIGKLPALLASFTILEGGLIVCLAAHHHLVDGTGMASLNEIWAKNTAGLPFDCAIDLQEPLRRYQHVVNAVGRPEPDGAGQSPAPVGTGFADAKTQSVVPPSGTQAEQGHAVLPAPRISVRTFTFDVSALNKLRDKLVDADDGTRPSAILVLCSLLWCVISSARYERAKSSDSGLDAAQIETTLILPVNCRSSFPAGAEPGRPEWLGNMTQGVIASQMLSVGAGRCGDEQYPAALPSVLKTVRQVLASTRDWSNVRANIQGLAQVPDARLLRKTRYGENVFCMTSWANFPLYPDFGREVGSAEFVKVPINNAFDGLAIVLPRRRAGDGVYGDVIELEMCLREDDMAAFGANDNIVALLKEPLAHRDIR